MAKKNSKLSKSERREARLQKARQWVLTYEGSHIVRAYCERFHVDTVCAQKDLAEIGALQPEKRAEMKQHEEARLHKRNEERAAANKKEISRERYPDSDDTYFFIAGYTSGGVPFGVTWEDMGLEPYETLF